MRNNITPKCGCFWNGSHWFRLCDFHYKQFMESFEQAVPPDGEIEVSVGITVERMKKQDKLEL